MKEFFQDARFTTFLWNTVSWLGAIVATYLTDIDYKYAIILVPVISLITKELNKAFNPNYKK